MRKAGAMPALVIAKKHTKHGWRGITTLPADADSTDDFVLRHSSLDCTASLANKLYVTKRFAAQVKRGAYLIHKKRGTFISYPLAYK